MSQIEGIQIGTRVVSPEEFGEYYQAVELAIELCYQLPGQSGSTPNLQALCRGVRHGLLELREVMHEARQEFAQWAKELTR